MGSFKEIYGDLFDGALNGEYDVIAQGNNCFNCQGAGIVIPFNKHFQTDKFPMELTGKGDFNKLGQIDTKEFYIKDKKVYNLPVGRPGFGCRSLTVCNCYTQYHYGKNHEDGVSAPFDKEAFILCMRKIDYKFRGMRIGLPAIGAGLAGGNLDEIKEIMKKELKHCDVTLVLFNK